MQAVLTGDIVGSSGLSLEDHRKVVRIVKSVADVFPDAVVGAVDVYSGDSWQLLVSDCSISFRIALYLRASLKREKAFSVDSRVSIACGEVDMEQVDMDRMSESTGELFVISGRGLDGLKKTSLMCFVALQDLYLSSAVGAAFELMDVLVRQWSNEQARAVAETLLGKTQAAIASTVGVSQSSINKSLQAAHWGEIMNTLDSIDRLFLSPLRVINANNHPEG